MAKDERANSGVSFAPKVLIVDDEHNLVELVQHYMRNEGFRVETAADGIAALEKTRNEQPDLIILDLMLPGLDGVEVCRKLRQFSDAYVIMLTARSEEMDKIVGLSVGADDYLTKPFSPRELVARVKAMLRRPRQTGWTGVPAPEEPDLTPPIIFDGLMIDTAQHEVSRYGRLVHLTPREFNLLVTLAAYPGHVFTRNQLLERIWGDRYYDDHVVDVHVTNLRRKIEEDPMRPRFIETVRGVGYKFTVRPPQATPALRIEW